MEEAQSEKPRVGPLRLLVAVLCALACLAFVVIGLGAAVSGELGPAARIFGGAVFMFGFFWVALHPDPKKGGTEE